MEQQTQGRDKVIRIQNIYYMLAYAFRVLNESGYRRLGSEDFANTAELFAAVLARGISTQLKHGLGREYIEHTDSVSSLRGKIDVSGSIKTLAFLRSQMLCTYDDFSVDSYMNRIIKSSVMELLKSDISGERKSELRKLLVFFGEVDTIDLRCVDWNNMRFSKNNQTYRMLIFICRLMAEGLIQNHAGGNTRMMDFLDDQSMHKLYERFILEYYRREFPQVNAGASHIAWQLDGGERYMLPVMKTDITLTFGGKTLIIDAKYYSHIMQEHFGVSSIHSGNMYQIFTYVKNKAAELSGAGYAHEVSGMLLYAKTDEDISPDIEYSMSGNMIAVKTLDLGADFAAISGELDGIVERFLLKREE
ncbi:MAG: 5-methylcytosine-specific restriction endonuclease system specificity protein McrC [Synergistaceae bacterium]|nr:5-methylcytosine-specific restriction endonuclease system specificity protein McrC [Synergistaceae bacterium]